MKPRTGIALGVLLLTGAGSLWAAQPRLRLKVSTHSGRVPLLLGLQGSASGVEPAEMAGCRVRIDRTYKTPGGQVLHERNDVPCAEPKGDSGPLAFKQDVTLAEPGDYELRLILTPASGREMAGTTQEVKVYHRIEVGGRGTVRRSDEQEHPD